MVYGIISIFVTFSKRGTGAFSSAGSERLPYKQRVGGSNPSTPTSPLSSFLREIGAFSSAGSERLPYKQRVGGSNPSTPTSKGWTHREKKRCSQNGQLDRQKRIYLKRKRRDFLRRMSIKEYLTDFESPLPSILYILQ